MNYSVYLDNSGNFSIVQAKGKQQARKWSLDYFGRSRFNSIEKASNEDLEWYKAMGGVILDATKEQNE